MQKWKSFLIISLDDYVKNLLPLFSFRKNKKSDKEANDSDSSDDDGEKVIMSESEDDEDEIDY